MRRLGHFKSDGGGWCDFYICRQILEESSCLILKRHSDRKYQGGVAAMFTTTVSRPLIGRWPRDLAADWLLSVVVNIAAMADLPATRPASIHGNPGCHGKWRQTVSAMVARWWQSMATSAYLEILLGSLGRGSAGKGHKSHGRSRLSVLAGHF